jgi:nucleotide-binding universal stress UspA family protein
MSGTVLAALDNSLAATPVVAAARALASLLDARPEAVHVRIDSDRTARSAAAAGALPLHTESGPVIERLIEAGEAEDVVALAIGARSTPIARHPLGSTAAAVASAVLKPVVVVPPDARVAAEFQRVLVPIEASVSAAIGPQVVFDLAREKTLEAVALHVYGADSLPRFTDQPQHEQASWTREFLARYCPAGISDVRLETRVGRAADFVAAVADDCGCDLIALGWSQAIAEGRARVVRGTLERSRLPILLVPVRLAGSTENVGQAQPVRDGRQLAPTGAAR